MFTAFNQVHIQVFMRHLFLSVLIALLLAQFALAGTGIHQLHASEQRHDDSQNSHIHLEVKSSPQASAELAELDFSELCLDCQCHGGMSMMAANASLADGIPASYRASSAPVNFNSLFSDPSFRPPIV